jgi:xanthine dehydrogenase YagS FAD-binding subunit
MSAVAVLKEPVGPSDDDVKNAMYGNICRCGAYPTSSPRCSTFAATPNQFSRTGATMDAFNSPAPESLTRPRSPEPSAQFVAGGTNLIDMMKLDVERPKVVVDINPCRSARSPPRPSGGLILGALARNSDVAHHPIVQRDYAVLSQALLSGASPQLRNMATTGGNLLQRTRCPYFRDTAHACNKREPGTGCSAIGRPQPHARHPRHQRALHRHQPLRPERRAHRARSHHPDPRRKRHAHRPHPRLLQAPGATPHIETVLQPGELITSVTLPPPVGGSKSLYLKLRDRAAYEFALASAAIVIKLTNNRIDYARVALGGVGTKPWRSLEAEAVLHGAPADPITFRRAAEAALKDARPQSENGFKVDSRAAASSAPSPPQPIRLIRALQENRP